MDDFTFTMGDVKFDNAAQTSSWEGVKKTLTIHNLQFTCSY